ncbi:hypothetical protein BH10BAC4_BH10BAC4_15610 [soil metagenome]
MKKLSLSRINHISDNRPFISGNELKFTAKNRAAKAPVQPGYEENRAAQPMCQYIFRPSRRDKMDIIAAKDDSIRLTLFSLLKSPQGRG